MRRYGWVGALVSLAAFQAPLMGEEYDDPAVVVCESLLKFKDVPPGAKYTRLRSTVSGLLVTVDYQIQVMTIAPKAVTKQCAFEVDGRKQFAVVKPPLPDCEPIFARAKDVIARVQKQVRSGNRDISEAEAVGEEVKACNDHLQREAEAQMKEVLDVYMPLNIAGVYPIAPDLTRLKAPWKC